MQGAPLCRKELSFVSIEEIEDSERDLMQGINFEMRCHHPFGAVKVLTSEIERFLANAERARCQSWNMDSCRRGTSPRSVQDFPGHGELGLREKALLVAQSALLFSDVPFLFPPGQIAFAAVAMCMSKSKNSSCRLPSALQAYLRTRFPSKTDEELFNFEDQVCSIMDKLKASPVMDIKMISISRNAIPCDDMVAKQADELRRVFFKVSSIRTPQRRVFGNVMNRKRKYATCYKMSPVGRDCAKIAKVTPTKL